MSWPAAASNRLRFVIRPACDDDMGPVHAIYAHHVRFGLGSFEEEPPDVEELARRRAEVTRQGLPYLVADAGGRVVGYAYAGLYRTRSAYRYAVEDSIYVAPDCQRQGIARELLGGLVHICTEGGYRQMLAVIGDSANHGSIGVHTALGFREVARLQSVGFKFGRWVDSLVMQRALGPGDTALPAR